MLRALTDWMNLAEHFRQQAGNQSSGQKAALPWKVTETTGSAQGESSLGCQTIGKILFSTLLF